MNVTPEDRQKLIEDIQQQNALGLETLGVAIRRLRIEVTGLDQQSFASMCKMSTKALYQLESDKGNPTINTLNGILRMFGLTMTLGSIRRSPATTPEPHIVSRKRGTRPAKLRRNA